MANTFLAEHLPADGETRVFVCKAKGCAKKHKCEFNKLIQAVAAADVRVDLVGCQGSCSGPTAVIVDSDGPRWFEDLLSKSGRADLVSLATGEIDKPTKRLKKRELTGKQKKRALRKLVKQIDSSSTLVS